MMSMSYLKWKAVQMSNKHKTFLNQEWRHFIPIAIKLFTLDLNKKGRLQSILVLDLHTWFDIVHKSFR
jgi:hypothetical protein